MSIVSKKIAEDICCDDSGKIFLAAVIEVTAPAVSFEMFERGGTVLDPQVAPIRCALQEVEGIEMDVVQDMQKNARRIRYGSFSCGLGRAYRSARIAC